MATEYLSWWPTSSWMSPGAALFLLCNVLIGPIVVTSRGEQRGRAAASTRRLCRSASSMVLDRLRSFSMFSVHSVSIEEDYHLSMELQVGDQQPQPAVADPAIIAMASASSPIAAAEAPATTESAKEVAEAGEVVHAAHLQSSPSQAVAGGAAEATATAAAERPAAMIAESIVQHARACRREIVEEALEGKAALNARAELFIQQFREDLKLQRLNSIINYTRALRRGAGMAPAAAGE